MSKEDKKNGQQPDAEDRQQTADDILKAHGFELVTDEKQEPMAMPDLTLFDDDVVDQNIIVYSVKRIGERQTQFGMTVDYLLRIGNRKGEKYDLRTNHAYVFTLIYKLDKAKRPLKVRIRKSGKRYFVANWIE